MAHSLPCGPFRRSGMSKVLAVPPASSAEVRFVCPRCKGELAADESSYRCDPCAITFPVLFGIPDFRLRGDRYLSLEDERAKARRLYGFGQNASIEELVQFYYSITYDLPPRMAQ